MNCDISKFENFRFCSQNNFTFFIETGYNCPMNVGVNNFAEELVYLFSKLAFSLSSVRVSMENYCSRSVVGQFLS